MQGFKLELPFSLDSEVVSVRITMALCCMTSAIFERSGENLKLRASCDNRDAS